MLLLHSMVFGSYALLGLTKRLNSGPSHNGRLFSDLAPREILTPIGEAGWSPFWTACNARLGREVATRSHPQGPAAVIVPVSTRHDDV